MSTLTPFSSLQNYFNYLNQSVWSTWKHTNNDDKLKNNDDSRKKKMYFEKNVKIKMREHLNSNFSRKQIYIQSIDKIKSKPFFGHGLSNFEFKIVMKSTNDNNLSRGNAESQFNQILLEKGFIGLILWMVLFKILFNSKKLISAENIILLGLMTYCVFVTLQFYFFFWLLISSCAALRFNSSKNFL
jgi:hypothetical protein